MTQNERVNLALSYENAWFAVKKSKCLVTVEPNGWFTVNRGGLNSSERASKLLSGLVVLTRRLANKDVVQNGKTIPVSFDVFNFR
jgi:hypothetical protein